MDATAYKGPAASIQTDKDGRKFVVSPDGYKYLLVDTGAKSVPKVSQQLIHPTHPPILSVR